MIDPEPARRDLLTALTAVHRDAAPEAVHTVRTAAGRLRVWLVMSGRRMLDDDLGWLRDCAAPVREVQVVRERHVPGRLDAWLAGELARRRQAMDGSLGGGRLDGVRHALPLLVPFPRKDAERALGAFERRVKRRGVGLVANSPIDRFHRLRRGMRGLRYAREWLGRDTAKLKEALTALGDLNDTAAALRFTDACPARAELAGFREDERRRLASERRRAIEACEAARP